MVPAIRTERLSRQFGGKTAVDQVHIEVMPGTFYGFLGPNGAGKSTTIKMLTGLLQPSSGSIEVLGRNMLDEAQSLEVKRSIGVIPENLALFDYLTAMEYLTFVGRIHGLDRDTIRQRSREMLDLLDLEDDSKKVSNDFSHGMRKKLSLAAALIHRPSLLFLDEPSSGLDPVTSAELDELIRSLSRNLGITFVIASHELSSIFAIADRVIMLDGGGIVAEGDPRELRDRPTNDYVRAFFHHGKERAAA